MGSPVSPVIANIYMEYFESLAIPSSSALIKWWFRYVDDVHSATRKDQANKLQEHLSSMDPHIMLIMGLPGADGLPFLDALTGPTPDSIESKVCGGPIHVNGYLDYNSGHPILADLSVIHTLIHRAKQVCSTPEFLAKEIDHLTKSYKITTTQHSSFNKTNPNREPAKSQTHPQ